MADLIKDSLFVEMVETPLSEAESAYYLREGWNLVYEVYPNINQLGCLWSQFQLESGLGKKMRCFNYGNIKKTAGHSWTMYQCHEYINGVKQVFYPPHIQTGFNAYSDPILGAKEYIEFLKNRKRYLAAWDGLVAGDLARFNRGLKAGGYYTADETAYLNRLQFHWKDFQKNAEKFLAWQPETPLPVVELVDRLSRLFNQFLTSRL